MKLLVMLTAMLVVFPSIVQAQTYTVVNVPLVGECLDDNTLYVHGTLNISGTEVPISSQNITCPDGCVVGADQYGDDCRFNETQCYPQEIGTLAFGNLFNYGVGGMLMFIGAGLIVETFMRGKEKKRRDLFGQPEY